MPVVIELPGWVAPMVTDDVRPRVTGLILKRIFEQGSTVREGDVLYLIDPAPFRAKLASYRQRWMRHWPLRRLPGRKRIGRRNCCRAALPAGRRPKAPSRNWRRPMPMSNERGRFEHRAARAAIYRNPRADLGEDRLRTGDGRRFW
ncbi:hypothetical protein [Agrobacterium larrymoorei]|uniref:Multidrug resistance protein MdtA-like barrel-sandwich hybrid domain-containing protein n=1 Tax=Agrobacterium larrymoorei TaxID=160699 RepID=A0A4D7E6K6_9HYPH|nr:hypothetical protein [Agrobacterium larrymoorei]QCJ01041.1 hypothetical protein CFBP5473_24090 [Agrobacterium larrymoorei]QYA10376.1 hypothetical protein J5285_22745 [Agrobacterium larrymoorei]